MIFRRSFEQDLRSSDEMSIADWKKRPLLWRLLAWTAYLFRQFL